MEANCTCTLEQGRTQDSERIYQVHTAAIKQLCSSHYDEKEISTWAGKQRKETYIPLLESGDIIVAKKNGMIVGFIHHCENVKDVSTNDLHCGLSKQSSNVEIEIKGLFIDPSYARNGVGKLLVKEVEARALKRGAAVMTVSASLNSLPFYEKMGFREVGRKPHAITCQCSVQCVSMVKGLEKQ